MKRSTYVRCRKGRECPVCEHDSWCSIGSEGQVMCRRVESAKAKVDKNGQPYWVHDLGDPRGEIAKREATSTPKMTESELMVIHRDHLRAGSHTARVNEARRLGVSAKALEIMQVGGGRDARGSYTLWPMFGPELRLVGLMRRYENGEKKYWRGGGAGVFVPMGSFVTDPAQYRTMHVVEGGSDVAAMVDIGLRVVGRPSNTGGLPFLRWVRSVNKSVQFIVCAERDWRPTEKCDCSRDRYCGQCWPGLYGASLVAKEIGGVIAWPKYPAKDVRESIQRFGAPY